MDPRHPQHPFSRTAAPPYSHAPFQTTSSQAPFPPSSHPASAPSYPDTQRRTSENNYYPQTSAYSRDSAPMPTPGHSRHTSTSSINHGAPVNRNMLPPSSPQQQHQAPPHAPHTHSLSYPHPPLSRGPPPSLTSPSNFQTGRDLPSLSTTHRPGGLNSSSMSISSMLGGSPTETREAAPPTSQYPTASSMMVSAPPSAYSAPVHASPRSSTGAPDYRHFRRPRTPEHRVHEPQGLRDRANSAGSPVGPPSLSTPDAHRYSTPQAYPQRSAPQHHQASSLDDRREQYPLRVPNPNSAFPPRPSSQPASFNAPPPRLNEPSRRVPDAVRPETVYGRPIIYGERDELHAFLEERRLEEEAMMRRERERERERERDRERLELIERERIERLHFAVTGTRPGEPAPYGRQYDPQQSGSYNDPRERDSWIMRARQEQQAQEQPPPSQPQAPVSAGYEYPRTQAQSYPPAVYASHETRLPPNSYGQGRASPPRPQNQPQFDNSGEDRQRMAGADPPLPQAYQLSGHVVGGPYRLHESPRSRVSEELQQLQQRQYLGIQHEINRKGRSSPFPQAVQGAQGQMSGPGGEPGIKSEFGKMFSGIGSGVGSMASGAGTPGGGTQTPFSSSAQLRREDLDGLITQESAADGGGLKLFRTTSRGGRRRKLKEEEGKDDDNSSTGRRTPSGRGSKRPKVGQYQSSATNRHINQIQESGDQISSPSNSNPNPFSNAGVTQAAQSSPTAESKVLVPHHHHINRHHHHHHHVGSHHRSTPVPAATAPASIPKPKQIVRSNAVLDSIAHLPRRHLGHGIYQTSLTPSEPHSLEHSLNPRRGFASTPEPLPRFEDQENCTFTIRIPRIHLASLSREEITSRRAVWGTDIYTDDSDVIAACIHSGWIRGEWHKDVDVSLLGLVIDPLEDERSDGEPNEPTKEPETSKGKKKRFSKDKDIVLTKPPPNGPMPPPLDYDLRATVLILPTLEKYSSTTRWGIMSREWKSTHDGLSFMILNLRWVRGAGINTAEAATGKARKARMKVALDEDVDDEVAWSSLIENGNGQGPAVSSENAGVQESFVRSERIPGQRNGSAARGPTREMQGLGMGSWWLETEREKRTHRKTKSKSKSADVRPTDKENVEVADVQVKVEERADHVAVAIAS